MRLVVASESARLGDTPRQLALGLGLTCDADDTVGYDALPLRLAHGPAALVLVTLGRDKAAGLAAVQQAAAETVAPVLAAGPTHDPQLILQALRAGARAYLDERFLRDELCTVLAQLAQSGAVADE